MKSIVALLIGMAAMGFGIANVTRFAPEEAFGNKAVALQKVDVEKDAAVLFAKVDLNQDGRIDVDEYAAQKLVRASLARFTGVVVVDGQEVQHINVPAKVVGKMAPHEQTTIDAIARSEFYQVSGDNAYLEKAEWLALSQLNFSEADFDRNNRLQGRELDFYALKVAQSRNVLS